MSVLSVIQRWVIARLAADSTLATAVGGRIYWQGAPAGAVRPHVIARVQGGTDVSVMPHTRVLSRIPLAIYGVTDGQSAQGAAETIAARIDAVLHGQRGSVSGGGTILSCIRRQPLTLPVADSRDWLTVLGGVYDIEAQEA